MRRQARLLFRQPTDAEIDGLLDASLAEVEGWTA
jgi:hypothetical protein